MANEAKETKKVETPVPGAEVSTDNGAATEDFDNLNQEHSEVNTEKAPQWAIDLKETCDAVLTAIGQFNENAANVVKDIIAEAKGEANTPSEKPKVQSSASVKINKKAKYVVANGKSFYSSVSGSVVVEGTDITGLETERLEKLLALGIAVEKSEED